MRQCLLPRTRGESGLARPGRGRSRHKLLTGELESGLFQISLHFRYIDGPARGHIGAEVSYSGFARGVLPVRHEYTVFDDHGRQKEGTDILPWNLAGPLCFSGDIIAKNVQLPRIEEGDYLVIHDTGSYTFSMWSRYNSRQTPRIIGYRNDEFEILKERETLEELSAFWK